MNTGTRTQVPETSRLGMSRILRLLPRSLCSSLVSVGLVDPLINDRTRQGQDIESDPLAQVLARFERHRSAVVGELRLQDLPRHHTA